MLTQICIPKTKWRKMEMKIMHNNSKIQIERMHDKLKKKLLKVPKKFKLTIILEKHQ